jgi:hypothetical protein
MVIAHLSRQPGNNRLGNIHGTDILSSSVNGNYHRQVKRQSTLDVIRSTNRASGRTINIIIKLRHPAGYSRTQSVRRQVRWCTQHSKSCATCFEFSEQTPFLLQPAPFLQGEPAWQRTITGLLIPAE